MKSLAQLPKEGILKRGLLLDALLLKGEEQEQLFELARKKRSEYFPLEEVEVRSVIEISNICQRKCNFCNINFYSKSRKRYVIKYDEIMKIIAHIYHEKNRRVLLFQSGENRSRSYIDFVSRCVNEIKQKFNDLVIILCLGNLSYGQYKQLREAGADRYILKFETSNPVVYSKIKPDGSLNERIKCLEMLNDLGFEVGTGNIIGLPGQNKDDIVNDLLFIRQFKLTMVSASVFIPGEDSNYREKAMGNINITLNYMALMRILYPQMLIPTTSSLEKAKRGGQYLGLMAGANTVTVHDGTPAGLKKHFPIYSVSRFIPDEKHIRTIALRAHLHFAGEPANDKAGLQLVS